MEKCFSTSEVIMIIAPEVIVTPDLPTIRFREPMDHVNLDTELPKILHSQGWGCGTYFHVQFLSHDKSILLASVQFVVSQVSESIHTSETNPYQPVTKTVFGRKADQVGEWWICESHKTENKKEADTKIVVWNPGKKVHQVKMGEKVIFESTDKELANQVADGKVAVPAAA